MIGNVKSINRYISRRKYQRKCTRHPARQMKICMVCSKTEARPTAHGLLICDACKKFFQRNEDEDWQALRCVTGLGKCTIVSVIGKVACARCRFWKCLSVGMKLKGKELISIPTASCGDCKKMSPLSIASCSWSERSTPVPAAASPSVPETLQDNIITAHFSLLRLHTVYRTRDLERTANSQLPTWIDFLERFDSMTNVVLSFVKQLSGYNELTVGDRRKLFGNSLIPIATLTFCEPWQEAPKPFFGMDSFQLYQFLLNFPIFQEAVLQFQEVASILAEIELTVTNFSLLEGLLFYRQTQPAKSFNNPQLIATMRNSYEMAFTMSYLTDDPNNFHSIHRYSRAMQAVTLAEIGVLKFAIAANRLKLGRPDLFAGHYSNGSKRCQLFGEIIDELTCYRHLLDS